MVMTWYERSQQAKQALQAAREALDAAERRLDGYHRALQSSTRVYRGYQRDEYERSAGVARKAALEELHEAVRHVGDAITAWWPNMAVSYWLTDSTAAPEAPGE